MSDVNPTNSASYRPGDEKRGYNELITLTLTDRECADLMNTIFEFTSGHSLLPTRNGSGWKTSWGCRRKIA